jgi:two-component system nitrate/nitrite response regulator NarL
VLLVAQGLSNKEIARRLNITDGTVKTHLHNIYHHLGIRNRTALSAFVHGRPADYFAGSPIRVPSQNSSLSVRIVRSWRM